MNNLTSQPLDAVDLLLVAGLVTLEATTVLAVALVALLLTVAGWRPPAADGQKDSPLAPLQHPLATLATELEVLPVTRLRELAGTRSKRLRKCELVAVLAAC